VVTPEATRVGIPKACGGAGVNVSWEKPRPRTVEEGEGVVRRARSTGKICAVNYGYSA